MVKILTFFLLTDIFLVRFSADFLTDKLRKALLKSRDIFSERVIFVWQILGVKNYRGLATNVFAGDDAGKHLFA